MTSIKDSLGSWSFMFGPVVALVMIAVLALLLRWAFARGRSVVTPASMAAAQNAEDGELLVEAARYRNGIEAEYFRCVLGGEGIASVVTPARGYELLLVPESDCARAQAVLRANPVD